MVTYECLAEPVRSTAMEGGTGIAVDVNGLNPGI